MARQRDDKRRADVRRKLSESLRERQQVQAYTIQYLRNEEGSQIQRIYTPRILHPLPKPRPIPGRNHWYQFPLYKTQYHEQLINARSEAPKPRTGAYIVDTPNEQRIYINRFGYIPPAFQPLYAACFKGGDPNEIMAAADRVWFHFGNDVAEPHAPPRRAQRKMDAGPHTQRKPRGKGAQRHPPSPAISQESGGAPATERGDSRDQPDVIIEINGEVIT